jgi:hypothetical protein
MARTVWERDLAALNVETLEATPAMQRGLPYVGLRRPSHSLTGCGARPQRINGEFTMTPLDHDCTRRTRYHAVEILSKLAAGTIWTVPSWSTAPVSCRPAHREVCHHPTTYRDPRSSEHPPCARVSRVLFFLRYLLQQHRLQLFPLTGGVGS